MLTKLVEYDDFWGDVWYNFKENSDIYKKCFEPIDEQESCTDDSIKEIIRKLPFRKSVPTVYKLIFIRFPLFLFIFP